MNLLVLSYANKENINLDNYVNSLKKYKYNYKIIGDKEKWINYMTKINGYYNYLITHNNNDLICITDSYDMICCGSEEELIDKFKTFNKEIIFSSEINCDKSKCIHLNNYYKLNESSKYYKYLNSGFIIGKYDKIIQLLKFMIDTSNKTKIVDDQLLACIYVEKFPHNVGLDIHCKMIGTICQNFFDYKWYNNRVYNKKTKQFQCFIHCPSMNSDLSFRLDYFGSKILNNKYKKDKLFNKIKIVYTKSNKFYLFIILTLLVILFYLFPNIMLIIILLIILLFMILIK